MKRNIFILILLLLAGASIIFIPYIFRAKEDNSLVSDIINSKTLVVQQATNDAVIKTDFTFDEKKQGDFDNRKVNFKNIEVLYTKLEHTQVELIKQRLQSFILQCISQDIKECTIEPDSLNFNGDQVSFTARANEATMEVTYEKGKTTIKMSLKNKP